MARGLFYSKVSVLIFAILTSLAIIYSMYNKLKVAEDNLAEYKLAITCISKENCREKVEAKILNSYSEKVDYHGKGGGFRDTVYVFLISSALGEKTIEISANPPSVGVPFDIGNVHVPPDTGKDFIKENFYNGETIFVEIWRGQMIFLYVDSIVDIPNHIAQTDPISMLQESPVTINAVLPKTYEIAMPTMDHPILLHAVAQYNFSWSIFYCFLGMLVVFVSVYKMR